MPDRNQKAFAQDVIFMRQKQHEIQAMKDSTAEKLVNESIDTLWLMQDKSKTTAYLAEALNEKNRVVGAAAQAETELKNAQANRDAKMLDLQNKDFDLQNKYLDLKNKEAELEVKHPLPVIMGIQKEVAAAQAAVESAKMTLESCKAALESANQECKVKEDAARVPVANRLQAEAKYKAAEAKANQYEEFAGHYLVLNTSKDKEAKATAKEKIINVVKDVTAAATANFQITVDRKALGLTDEAKVDAKVFDEKWKALHATLEQKHQLAGLINQFGLAGEEKTDYRFDPYSDYHDDGGKYGDDRWENVKVWFWRAWNYRAPWKNKDEVIKDSPAHHAEVLHNIKLYFHDQQSELLERIEPKERAPGLLDKTILRFTERYKRRKLNLERINEFNALANKLYHQTLVDYYKSLNPAPVEDDFIENDDNKGKEQNKRAYRFGYEIENTKDELANKKAEQNFLKAGFSITKLFAYAQGIFVGGAWLFVFLTIYPPLAYAGAVLLPFMFHAARSNWISANDEMGPSLKSLFYNPAHVHMSPVKKLGLWLKHSELSFRATLRTAKGQANFIAAAFIGILTMVGGLEISRLIPNFALWNLGPMGAAIAPAVVILPVLAAVTILIYFVLANGSQLEENRARAKAEKEGKVYLADYKERLNKLKAINNVNNPLKGYKVGVAAALFGIGSTLVGASSTLSNLLSVGIPHKGEVLFKVGRLSLSGPAALAVLTSLLVVVAACVGMFVFYRRRTRGSTEQGISSVMGTTFDELKGHKLKSLDLTGVNAPDLEANAFKTSDSILFTTHDEKVNAQTSRIYNAVAQAGPAVVGAMTFFTLVTCGAAALVGGDLIVAGAIGMFAGVMAGIAAAVASYSANSTGNRQPKENVTEVNFLEQDKAALGAVEADYKASPFYKLGIERRAGMRYLEGTERENEYDGFGVSIRKGTNGESTSIHKAYTKPEKRDAAVNMIESIDASVNQDMDVESNDLPVKSPLFQSYLKYGDAQPGFRVHTPYENGRLGEIASEAAHTLKGIKRATVGAG